VKVYLLLVNDEEFFFYSDDSEADESREGTIRLARRASGAGSRNAGTGSRRSFMKPMPEWRGGRVDAGTGCTR